MRRGYLDAMTVEQLMDAAAVRLKAEEVGGVDVIVNLRFGDSRPTDRLAGVDRRTGPCTPSPGHGVGATRP